MVFGQEEGHIFSLPNSIKGKVDKNTSIYSAFIDLEKAFHWVNRYFLLYNLVSNNIDGKFYFAIKSLPCETVSNRGIIVERSISRTNAE